MATTSTPLPAPLVQLAELSNFYGKNPDYVLAGGGNTSVKIDGTMYIKGSGTELATVAPEQFVPLIRAKVSHTLVKDYSKDPVLREEQIIKDLLDARVGPDCGRPSVETALHNMFDSTFVVHLHPHLVNTLTCAQQGEKIVEKLFGDTAAWLGYTDPGYILAKAVEKRLAAYRKTHGGKDPEYLFIQNHGPFIPADSPAHARRKLANLFGKLHEFHAKKASKMGARNGVIGDGREELIAVLAPVLRSALAETGLKIVVFDDSPITLDFVATDVGKKLLVTGPLTPDQIVYCKSFPLWIPCRKGDSPETIVKRLGTRLAQFRAKRGYDPKVVAVEGLGLFAVGDTVKGARTVRDVYVDALKIMKGTFAAGGTHFMTPRQYGFIDNWEVEQYRRKVSAASAAAGKLRNRVAVVVGAAGPGVQSIVEGLSREGAFVALIDGDFASIREAAELLVGERGLGAALALKANPANAGSVQRAAEQVVRTYGGVDVLVHVVSTPKEAKSATGSDPAAAATGREFQAIFKAFAPLMAVQSAVQAKASGNIVQVIREANGAASLCRLTVDASGVGKPSKSASVLANARKPKEVPDLTDAVLSLL